MIELTQEERERIYLEEKARMEVRQQLQDLPPLVVEEQTPPPKKGGHPIAKVIGGVGICVVLALAFLALVSAVISSPTPSLAGGNSAKTVRATYWCGVDFDDAGQIGVAVSRGDTAAIAGLLARGRAFQVEEGTRVFDAGEIDMGISAANIESGAQVGRKCYIATNALASQN